MVSLIHTERNEVSSDGPVRILFGLEITNLEMSSARRLLGSLGLIKVGS